MTGTQENLIDPPDIGSRGTSGDLLPQVLAQIRLTGDIGDCGACTLHLGGAVVKSSMILALSAEGQSITTIEGADNLAAIQAAFVAEMARYHDRYRFRPALRAGRKFCSTQEDQNLRS